MREGGAQSEGRSVPAMKRSATVSIGGFAKRILAGEGGDGKGYVAKRAERAIRAYLRDKEAEPPGWKAPPFAGREPAERVELRLSLDEDLWVAVEAEAADQGVSVDLLVSHALLYYVAEADAGEITRRILDDLDNGD
jgi:hypothetical protein